VQQRLGAIGTVFYRDAELNLYIQEALRFFNALTGFWRGRLLITTVANRVWNPLSSSLTSGMRVSFNDHPLSPTTLAISILAVVIGKARRLRVEAMFRLNQRCGHLRDCN
jgi:hypothetical protein